MAADSDADEIQREREDRQAAERRRLDGEKVRRREELARLKAFDAGARSPRAGPPVAASGTSGRPRSEPARPLAPNATPTPATDSRPRAPIGGPIRPESTRALLAVDPAEHFDVQTLNVVPLTGLVPSVEDDPRLLERVARRLLELMARVKQEVDDPLSAGAFLRERVLEWYRFSGADPDWPVRMATRWAGIFADSRVSGGTLHPWLNRRLAAARAEALSAGRLSARWRRGILRDRRTEASLARTPSQLIQSEVAQALLDDLVARPRDPDAPLPLVRLSELAVRRQVPTINDSLALLFSSPENGPFVVLHPNRYPDCEELVIRPPAPGSAGAALAYSLATARSSRRGAVRLSLSADGVVVAGAGADAAPGAENGESEIDASTVWEADPVGAATWLRVVDDRRRERRRLDPPPKDFRSRPAFAALRKLIVESAEFRKALLAAKWRGRPTGLPLLVALLQKGRYVPEVATDFEYLEAELAEWTDDGPDARPSEGVWAFDGWTVRRETAGDRGVAYRAERATGRPSRPA